MPDDQVTKRPDGAPSHTKALLAHVTTGVRLSLMRGQGWTGNTLPFANLI